MRSKNSFIAGSPPTSVEDFLQVFALSQRRVLTEEHFVLVLCPLQSAADPARYGGSISSLSSKNRMKTWPAPTPPRPESTPRRAKQHRSSRPLLPPRRLIAAPAAGPPPHSHRTAPADHPPTRAFSRSVFLEIGKKLCRINHGFRPGPHWSGTVAGNRQLRSVEFLIVSGSGRLGEYVSPSPIPGSLSTERSPAFRGRVFERAAAFLDGSCLPELDPKP